MQGRPAHRGDAEEFGDVCAFVGCCAECEPERAFGRGGVVIVRGAGGLASVVLGVAGVVPGGGTGSEAEDRAARYVV